MARARSGGIEAGLAEFGHTAGSMIIFTIYWQEQNRWDGSDYSLTVVEG